jgi:hypothetical protein
MYQPSPDHTWNISMREDEDASYCCRICGLKQDFKPWGEDGKTPAFEICSCCGVEFGNDVFLAFAFEASINQLPFEDLTRNRDLFQRCTKFDSHVRTNIRPFINNAINHL